jgi:hypothetical protein
MSAPAGYYNIIADQGATFARTLVWNDSAGNPVPMAGYSARMQVRVDYTSSGAPILELTTANNRISLASTSGQITLSIDATTMSNIGAGEYVYDLELVNGAIVTRLVQGSFTVRSEVTR